MGSNVRVDVERIRINVREAETEDLLDRATVYRDGMEPLALEIIIEELHRRGVTDAQMDEHANLRRQDMLPPRPDGSVIQCSFCRRPAVLSISGWYRLWNLVPVFPKQFHYCSEHAPAKPD